MRASVLAAVGAFWLALFAVGQQTSPPKPGGAAQDEPTRFSLEVTRVSMVFSVMDRKGRFVTDLTKDDFDVFENRKLQTISEFAAESDLPLRMGILIDTSNSIRDRFRIEQESASEFLKSLMRSNIDKAMIMSFDSKAELAADLTDNTAKLESTINGLRPGGGTALYDAIYLACRDQLSRDQPSARFRRIILVVSDGEDNQSEYTREQALEMALKADVVIFAVSTNNLTRGDTEGDKTLKYLTQQTGGRAYFPFRPEDLAQNFEIISEEVRHQYVILFRPDPLKTDGMFHPVELRVKGHKELAIRARSGYYAPKM